MPYDYSKTINAEKALIWRIVHRDNIPWILVNGLHAGNSQAESKGSADDIRQLSGYARDSKILKQLDLNEDEQQPKPVDCLIIYIDQSASETLPDDLLQTKINGLVNFYKLPIRLPTID